MLLRPTSYAELSLSDALLDLAVRFIVNCPPEDLNSSERLFFQIEEAHWFYDDFARAENPLLPYMKIKLFVKSLFKACPYLQSLNSDPVSALLQFQNYKRGIPVRGAIILNKGLNKVLMVRGWKGTHWSYPRGKINKNEPDDLCAIREVYEETGFDIAPYLVKENFIEVTREGKNIRLYVIAGVPEDTRFETQTRKEISEIKWHSLRSLPGYTSNPGATASNAAKFYTTMPFNRSLRKFIAKEKGLVASLSNKESAALKSLLGVSSGSHPVRNDEEAAQHLLSLLHSISAPSQKSPSPAAEPAKATGVSVDAESDKTTETSSDRQILLSLLKTGAGKDSASHQLESAQQILGLLNQEIATETTIKEVAPVVVQKPSAAQPAVPPNWMLESLVASRKSTTKTNTPSSDSNLLSILKPKPFHGLMSLLDPGDVSSADASVGQVPAAGNSASESLLSLLGVDSQSMTANKSSQQPVKVDKPEPSFSAGNSLLSLLEGDNSRLESETPEPVAVHTDKNALLSLLEPTRGSTPAPELQSSVHEAAASPAEVPADSNRAPASAALMSLLGDAAPSTQNTNRDRSPSPVEHDAEDEHAEKSIERSQSEFLMGLLRGPEHKSSVGTATAESQTVETSTSNEPLDQTAAPQEESKLSSALLSLLSPDNATKTEAHGSPAKKEPSEPAKKEPEPTKKEPEPTKTETPEPARKEPEPTKKEASELPVKESADRSASDALMSLLLGSAPKNPEESSQPPTASEIVHDETPESKPVTPVDTSRSASASLLGLLNP